MLWRRCSNFMATSWQPRRGKLSQREKLTSAQLLFSTVPQRCDNVNHDFVTTLSQRRWASWGNTKKGDSSVKINGPKASTSLKKVGNTTSTSKTEYNNSIRKYPWIVLSLYWHKLDIIRLVFKSVCTASMQEILLTELTHLMSLISLGA